MAGNWRLYDDARDQMRVTALRAYIKQIQQDDSIQRVRGTGSARTQNDRIEHLQPAGFSSNPGAGDKIEALFLDAQGESTHRMCLMVMGDRKNLRKVGPGEAVLYAPGDNNQYVLATPSGIIVNAPGQTVTIQGATNVNIVASNQITLNAPLVQVQGNLDVQGTITRIACPCC